VGALLTEVGSPGLEMLKYFGIALGMFLVELYVGSWGTACRAVITYKRQLFMNNTLRLYWWKVCTLGMSNHAHQDSQLKVYS